MSWFQRKRGKVDGPATEPPEEDAAPAAELPDDDERDDDVDDLERRRRESGPHDVSEVEEKVSRIDLGALRLPPRDGMELRLEMEEKTQRVVAATITLAGSSVQLQAFAAPRRAGIWDEIRSEIASQVTKQGGTADDVPGVFGREVLARLPVRTKDGRSGHRASRFIGVDGPRWFLRGVFTGPAAADEDVAAELEDVVRGVVVVRGSEAMAPRDLLQLKLPAGRPDQAPTETGTDAGTEASAAPAGDPLRPFERGPEITERR